MAVDVIMPAMGATQETGRLVRWFRREGDSITKGELLMEVETGKSVVEVEAPASGILARVTATPEDDIPVGQTIALILQAGEDPSGGGGPPVAGGRRKAPARQTTKGAPVAPGSVASGSSSVGRLLASPAARRLAKERGVELAGVQGTGPDGAVVARDVLSPSPGVLVDSGAGAPAPPDPMRRIIGERMTLSKQTAPHFYLSMDVDMTGVEARRDALKQPGAGPAPSVNDFVLKAASQALAESPAMNAAWTEGSIRQFGEVNLGVAVAVDGGLVVPVIRNADRLGLDELARRSRELARQARSGRLKPGDCQGGTFTVSNLGMFGVDSFVAIIHPPQCAILAVGRVAPRVVPHGDDIAVRPMLTMTLSADHRVVDGAIAARFLQRVRQHLEALRAPSGET